MAANADSATAMALEYSDGEFRPATGTSASTPLWAAMIALAGQPVGRHLGFVNPATYVIAGGAAYHQAFHDVITDDNSVLWPTGVFVGYNAVRARPAGSIAPERGRTDAQRTAAARNYASALLSAQGIAQDLAGA